LVHRLRVFSAFREGAGLPYSKEVRVRQTRAELERLTATLKVWEERRRASDKTADNQYRGQYQTQVTAIVAEVSGAASVIEDQLKSTCAAAATTPLAVVLQDCARNDRRIIWLWRALNYYRDKFDQRDDPGLAPALRAADEVVWSCFKPFFRGCGIALPAAPLPFIKDAYSPVALRPNEAGHLEKEALIDEGPLKPFFTKLPVPLLQLPPMVVTAPWAHVLIAHETGHFIQGLIPGPEDYRTTFRKTVANAAHEVRKCGEDAAAWAAWAAEIFGDLYSVALMGNWASWTMAHFEFARQEGLARRQASYPSPIVRIFLLSRFAAEMGCGESDLFSDFGIDIKAEAARSPDLRADLAVAEALARLIRAELPGDGITIPKAVGFNPGDYEEATGMGSGGEAVQWSEALLGRSQKTADHSLRAARLVAAGAARAWNQIAGMDPGQARDHAMNCLATSAFPRMIECAEPNVRAAPQKEAVQRLAPLVLDMSDEVLFS
jgi:hypothetical protein